MVQKIQYLTVSITVNISYTAAFSLQFIGNLKKLVHFDASTNNINWIAPEIGSCCSLTDVTLSCNEIHVSVLEMPFILRVPVFWDVTQCHWAHFLVLLDCFTLMIKAVCAFQTSATQRHTLKEPESSAAPLQEPKIFT
jgi:hypothetical protein